MTKKFSVEEKLKIQFQKARNKSYATNFLLEDEIKETEHSISENERVVVKIITPKNSYYLLTDKRILYSKEWSIPYGNIVSIYWMSENPIERPKLKKECPQRLILKTIDGKKIQLDDLGSSYLPFRKSIEWILKP